MFCDHVEVPLFQISKIKVIIMQERVNENSPISDHSAPNELTILSHSCNVFAYTGYALSSSLPIPGHCAPCPLKTNPNRGVVVMLCTGLLELSVKAAKRFSAFEAVTVAIQGKRLRLSQSVWARSTKEAALWYFSISFLICARRLAIIAFAAALSLALMTKSWFSGCWILSTVFFRCSRGKTDSSIITCVFVPPNPKLFTEARRTPDDETGQC